MNFDESDEQVALRDAVGQWTRKAFGLDVRRELVRTGGFSAAMWNEWAHLGLCGLTVPTDFGGTGMGPLESMVVLEELGRGVVTLPLGAHWIAAGLLASAQGPARAVAETWLPHMATTGSRVVLAAQERGQRYGILPLRTVATRQSDGRWLLRGEKHLVPAGDSAAAWLVPARRDGQDEARGEVSLFWVENGTSGATTRGYLTQDGSRAADLHLFDAAAHCLTHDAAEALEWAHDVAAAHACAQGVGAMDKALSLTVDYLGTRRQFGAPLASFQALRHRVADMKMHLELGRSMAYFAFLRLSEPAAARRAAVARAKVQLGQSMQYVGQQAVQLHGGIGVTEEAPISHYFRHLTQLELTAGDTLHHLSHVSDNLQDNAGVFT